MAQPVIKLVGVMLVTILLAGCGRPFEPPKIERIVDGQVTCWRINDGFRRPWNCTEVKP